MYGRAAWLLKNKVFRNALDTEKQCAKFKLNRNKLRRVLAMFQNGPLPLEVPESFRTGANPAMSLTQQKKIDLLSIISFHCKCSLTLTVE